MGQGAQRPCRVRPLAAHGRRGGRGRAGRYIYMTQPTIEDCYKTPLSGRRIAEYLLLLTGPLASYVLLRGATSGSADENGLALALFLIWSPVFFGVPAMLMQRERDGALTGEKSAVGRGVKLVPHLLTSPDSTARPRTLVSLIGWLILGAAAFRPLTTALSGILGGLFS